MSQTSSRVVKNVINFNKKGRSAAGLLKIIKDWSLGIIFFFNVLLFPNPSLFKRLFCLGFIVRRAPQDVVRVTLLWLFLDPLRSLSDDNLSRDMSEYTDLIKHNRRDIYSEAEQRTADDYQLSGGFYKSKSDTELKLLYGPLFLLCYIF